jgi:hypothetical protein
VNARTIRRAAERKTQKLALKSEAAASISQPQLAANRANAQLSTGPRTEEGKHISSLNAVRTGLTGQTVLLPSDDAAYYERHVQRFVADHKPETDRESELVQHLADGQWRMNRIPGLEMAIFARGRIQFAELFESYDERTAPVLADAETIIVYQRELRNLQTQEGRIRRHYQQDLTELQQLQQQRLLLSQPAPSMPLVMPSMPQLTQNGFDFSDQRLEYLDKRILELQAREQELMAEEAAQKLELKATQQ